MNSEIVLNEQKQLERQRARQHREKTFRRRLTTLSWALPVVAFGSFFSIWHNISSAVSTHGTSKPSTVTTTKKAKVNKMVTPTILFKLGSTSPKVQGIQQQLYELGYFNHAFTNYYGPVTEQAVKSFQVAQHLNPTGKIDHATLAALQQAVKHHHASRLTSSGVKKFVSSSTKTSVHAQPSIQHTSTGSSQTRTATKTPTVQQPSSPAVSQQSTPQTTSSAS